MIFLKIFKNTPKKSNIRPTQNVYKTFDFPSQCIFYNYVMHVYSVKIAHVTKIRRC